MHRYQRADAVKGSAGLADWFDIAQATGGLKNTHLRFDVLEKTQHAHTSEHCITLRAIRPHTMRAACVRLVQTFPTTMQTFP